MSVTIFDIRLRRRKMRRRPLEIGPQSEYATSLVGTRVAKERVAAGASALRSPIGWALLGLVIEQPSYGYELVQRFERTYGDSVALSSPSQVYTALDSLQTRSLVEEVPGEEEISAVARQPRPHYRATMDGVRAYQEWLIGQARKERRRSRLFSRQLAALAPEAALRVIDRYELACLAHARETPPDMPLDSPLDDVGGLADRLACEEDRLAVGARLSWIEYARREFRVLTQRRPRR